MIKARKYSCDLHGFISTMSSHEMDLPQGNISASPSSLMNNNGSNNGDSVCERSCIQQHGAVDITGGPRIMTPSSGSNAGMLQHSSSTAATTSSMQEVTESTKTNVLEKDSLFCISYRNDGRNNESMDAENRQRQEDACEILGKKDGFLGDPRMRRALAAKILNPNLSLRQALQANGFVFPSITSSTTTPCSTTVYDTDNISLAQRKNQLLRRIRAFKASKNKSVRQNRASGMIENKGHWEHEAAEQRQQRYISSMLNGKKNTLIGEMIAQQLQDQIMVDNTSNSTKQAPNNLVAYNSTTNPQLQNPHYQQNKSQALPVQQGLVGGTIQEITNARTTNQERKSNITNISKTASKIQSSSSPVNNRNDAGLSPPKQYNQSELARLLSENSLQLMQQQQQQLQSQLQAFSQHSMLTQCFSAIPSSVSPPLLVTRGINNYGLNQPIQGYLSNEDIMARRSLLSFNSPTYTHDNLVPSFQQRQLHHTMPASSLQRPQQPQTMPNQLIPSMGGLLSPTGACIHPGSSSQQQPLFNKNPLANKQNSFLQPPQTTPAISTNIHQLQQQLHNNTISQQLLLQQMLLDEESRRQNGLL